jgi:hypothetical protein
MISELLDLMPTAFKSRNCTMQLLTLEPLVVGETDLEEGGGGRGVLRRLTIEVMVLGFSDTSPTGGSREERET